LATPVTVIDLVSEPKTLEQATVMVFAPATTGTEAGDVAAVPLTVQLIVPEPVALNATLIGDVVVVDPVAGELMVVTGGVPRFTLTDALVGVTPLLQVTVIVFEPIVGSAAVFALLRPELEATPLTVQVVPAGIVVEPPTV